MISKSRWKVVVICAISGTGGMVVGWYDTPWWLTLVIGGVCTQIALWVMDEV